MTNLITPALLEADLDPEDLIIILFLQGNQVEALAHFVLDIIELDVGKVPFGDNLFYQYSKGMDSTLIIFQGRTWLHSLAKWIGRIKNTVNLTIWSNWNLPFVAATIPKTEFLNLEALGIDDAPSSGDLEDMTKYLERSVAVEEGRPEVLEALRKEFEGETEEDEEDDGDDFVRFST